MPAGLLGHLSADLCSYYGAAAARIYSIALETGRLREETDAGRGLPHRDAVDFDARDIPLAGPTSPVAVQAMHALQPRWVQYEWKQERFYNLCLPITRQGKAIGVVEIDVPASYQRSLLPSTEVSQTLDNIAAELGSLRARQVLATTAEFNVGLAGDNQAALAELTTFIGKTAGMQFAILRELDSRGGLRPVSAHGFKNGPESELNFANVANDYEPFQNVIVTRQAWSASDLNGDVYRTIRANPYLRDVKSFVACPVLVGKRLWGVLSFAASVEYPYTELEVLSLSVLANLAGVALASVQSANAAAQSSYDDLQLMQAVLANEVVLATRHEMDNHLAVIGAGSSSLQEKFQPVLLDPKRSTRLTRADLLDATDTINHIDAAHGEINKILDTVRVSQQAFISDHTQVNVGQAWNHARDPFHYRIARASLRRVTCDARTDVAGGLDLLRIVFMHLLLNSLDAFDRGGQRGSRAREIVLRETGQNGGHVTFQYHDTAGGIDVRGLTRSGRPVNEARDVPALVFERFVSSKRTGTGLGLASVRTVLDLMDGSIELVDWRGAGVTFRIELRQWDA